MNPKMMVGGFFVAVVALAVFLWLDDPQRRRKNEVYNSIKASYIKLCRELPEKAAAPEMVQMTGDLRSSWAQMRKAMSQYADAKDRKASQQELNLIAELYEASVKLTYLNLHVLVKVSDRLLGKLDDTIFMLMCVDYQRYQTDEAGLRECLAQAQATSAFAAMNQTLRQARLDLDKFMPAAETAVNKRLQDGENYSADLLSTELAKEARAQLTK